MMFFIHDGHSLVIFLTVKFHAAFALGNAIQIALFNVIVIAVKDEKSVVHQIHRSIDFLAHDCIEKQF